MPSSVGSADYVGTDSGNTSFIINCSALVLLMALPGIVVFYGAAAPVALFACVRLASPSICCESLVADRQKACAQDGTRATRCGCARANPARGAAATSLRRVRRPPRAKRGESDTDFGARRSCARDPALPFTVRLR